MTPTAPTAVGSRNPFPGARPLSREDSLIGREGDIDEFVEALGRHAVIELLGPSGVGKSSFLQAGIEPAIAAKPGWTVRSLRKWEVLHQPGHTAFDWFVQVLCQIFEEPPDLRKVVLDDKGARLDYVDWLYADSIPRPALRAHLSHRRSPSASGRCVLVFDQYEELLRHEPQLGRGFLEQLAQVTSYHAKSSRIVHVLSLRQEFEHELRKFGGELDDATLVRPIRLAPLPMTALPELVWRPLRSGGLLPEHDKSLEASITNAWERQTEGEPEPAFSPDETGLGLLHVQAFLYNLFDVAGPGGFASADAAAAALGIRWPKTRAQAGRLFVDALRVYVDRRLSTVRARTAEQLGDDVAVQTLKAVTGLVPQLSSAGYKLVRSLDDLAADQLSEFYDLHDAVNDPRDPRPLLRDCMRAARTAKTEDAVEVANALRKVLVQGWGDPSVLCGRLAPPPGETGDAVAGAAELFLTFMRAIDWLQRPEVAIIRTTSRRDGNVMAALVHDGFGDALTQWAHEARQRPDVQAESVVKIVGKQILRSEPDREHAVDPSVLPRTQNLGWLGCNVTAYFRGLTFAGCDFGGTIFSRCVFEDVTFEDCQLWGTLFLRCRFLGTKGTRIVTALPPSEACGRVQTLTFGAGCHAETGGVTLEGYGGYGYFVDGATGGPWRVIDSTVRHVGFRAGNAGLTASIEGPNLPFAVTYGRKVVLTAPAQVGAIAFD